MTWNYFSSYLLGVVLSVFITVNIKDLLKYFWMVDSCKNKDEPKNHCAFGNKKIIQMIVLEFLFVTVVHVV